MIQEWKHLIFINITYITPTQVVMNLYQDLIELLKV